MDIVSPHVFERFWRSPSARGLPGSGLGLSIVALVIRECGRDVARVRLPGMPAQPHTAP
jgi:two-component system, OmpR family, sensor histidine kinase MprB